MSSAEPAGDPEPLREPYVEGYRWQSWSMPTVASSVPFLRRWLRAVLDDTVLKPEQAHDLLLAVGEAVSNAIEHARNPTRPCIDLTVDVAGGCVTVVVRDYGEWRPGTSGQHRGRGLAMLSALADATVTSGRSGTTVTIRGSAPESEG